MDAHPPNHGWMDGFIYNILNILLIRRTPRRVRPSAFKPYSLLGLKPVWLYIQGSCILSWAPGLQQLTGRHQANDFWSLLGPLGRPLGPLGPLLRGSWALFGRFWNIFCRILSSNGLLGALLVDFYRFLVPPGASRPLKTMLGPTRGSKLTKITVFLLNCSWDPLGTLLGCSWDPLGALLAAHGALLAALEALLAALGALLAALGALLGVPGGPRRCFPNGGGGGRPKPRDPCPFICVYVYIYIYTHALVYVLID